MGTENKKPYSDALINCSVPRRTIAACPLAFGEVGVKGRVRSVLNYKKPQQFTLSENKEKVSDTKLLTINSVQ